MFPGMDPRQMKAMMKRLGIQPEEINASVVIIRTDDKEIILKSPEVLKLNMMGQEIFQITSKEIEENQIEKTPEITEEDIKTVMEQTNVSREQAIKAIKESNGDLAEAIMKLTEEQNKE